MLLHCCVLCIAFLCACVLGARADQPRRSATSVDTVQPDWDAVAARIGADAVAMRALSSAFAEAREILVQRSETTAGAAIFSLAELDEILDRRPRLRAGKDLKLVRAMQTRTSDAEFKQQGISVDSDEIELSAQCRHAIQAGAF